MGPSTLSSWALLIARRLRERGLDPSELFARAQVPVEPLSNPNARYPVPAMQRLWALAEATTQDHCFGLSVGSAWHPTTFHALGYSALASGTLREALEQVVRYCEIVTTGARLELVEADSEVRVTLRSRARDGVDLATVVRGPIQAGLSSLVVLCREARGGPVELRRVTVTDIDTAPGPTLREFFGCDVHFGATENALVFDEAEVDVPLPTSNPALMRLNQQMLTHYLARMESSALADRVRSQLIRLVPAGQVDQAVVARALNVSPRTLQRRLREEGVSFRQLVDEIRARLAEQYLADTTLATSEISYLLGFSEVSSFSRAMRRYGRQAVRREQA